MWHEKEHRWAWTPEQCVQCGTHTGGGNLHTAATPLLCGVRRALLLQLEALATLVQSEISQCVSSRSHLASGLCAQHLAQWLAVWSSMRPGSVERRTSLVGLSRDARCYAGQMQPMLMLAVT